MLRGQWKAHSCHRRAWGRVAVTDGVCSVRRGIDNRDSDRMQYNIVLFHLEICPVLMHFLDVGHLDSDSFSYDICNSLRCSLFIVQVC